MLENISYMLIFGLPLIVYLGIATIISFFITAALGVLIYTGRMSMDHIKWHWRMAAFALTLGLIHGILGVLLYL